MALFKILKYAVLITMVSITLETLALNSNDRLDLYLRPPVANQRKLHSVQPESNRPPRRSRKHPRSIGSPTEKPNPSLFSKVTGWLFPFGSSDTATSGTHSSPSYSAPPSKQYGGPSSQNCGQCNDVPWIPIGKPSVAVKYFPPPILISQNSHGHSSSQNTYGPPKDSYGPPTGSHGLPSNSYGPPKDSYGPPTDSHGPPSGLYGPPIELDSPPHSAYGPPTDSHGPPSNSYGPPTDSHGPPPGSYGPPIELDSPPPSAYGPPTDSHGPPPGSYGPPKDSYGPLIELDSPPPDSYGPPKDSYGPPVGSHGPPPSSYGPPKDSYGPPVDSHGPPPSSYGPPKDSYGPPVGSHGLPPNSYSPPKNSYGPPVDSHRPPPSSYSPPSDSFAAPIDSHGAPPNSYLPPKNSYRPPVSSHGAPIQDLHPPSKPLTDSYGKPIPPSDLAPPQAHPSSSSNIYTFENPPPNKFPNHFKPPSGPPHKPPPKNKGRPPFLSGPPQKPPGSRQPRPGQFRKPLRPPPNRRPPKGGPPRGLSGNKYIPHVHPEAESHLPQESTRIPVVSGEYSTMSGLNPPPRVPIPFPSLSSNPIPPIHNPQPFTNEFNEPLPNRNRPHQSQQQITSVTVNQQQTNYKQSEYNNDNLINQVLSMHSAAPDVQIVKSVPIAEFTSSVEYPPRVIQSPVIDVTTFGKNNAAGHNAIKDNDNKDTFQNNPIIVDDQNFDNHAAASTKNVTIHTFNVQPNSHHLNNNQQLTHHQQLNNGQSNHQQLNNQQSNNQQPNNQQSSNQQPNNQQSNSQQSSNQQSNHQQLNNQQSSHQHSNNQQSNNQQPNSQQPNNQQSNNQQLNSHQNVNHNIDVSHTQQSTEVRQNINLISQILNGEQNTHNSDVTIHQFSTQSKETSNHQNSDETIQKLHSQQFPPHLRPPHFDEDVEFSAPGDITLEGFEYTAEGGIIAPSNNFPFSKIHHEFNETIRESNSQHRDTKPFSIPDSPLLYLNPNLPNKEHKDFNRFSPNSLPHNNKDSSPNSSEKDISISGEITNTFTQPTMDYSSWIPSPGPLSTSMIPPSPNAEGSWPQPTGIDFTIRETEPPAGMTPPPPPFNTDTKKTKQIQIVIPYTSSDENKNSWTSDETIVGSPTSFATGFSNENQPQWLNRPQNDYHNYEESKQVTATQQPPRTTQKFNVPSNIHDILKNNALTEPRNTQTEAPFDVLLLQQNIDQWTVDEYANKTKINSENLKASTQNHLIPSKKIPKEYLTTTTPINAIATKNITYKYTKLFGDYEAAGTFNHETNFHNITVIADFNNTLFESNLIVPESVTHESQTTEYTDDVTETTPPVTTDMTTEITNSTTVSSTTVNHKPVWEQIQIQISPLTKEKVYVVTPVSLKIDEPTPSSAWSYIPRQPTPDEVNDLKSKNFSFSSPRFLVRPTPGSSAHGADHTSSVKVVYSAWPQAINNLETTTVRMSSTEAPLWGLMDLTAYTPPEGSSVRTYAGHSKVVTVVTPPNVSKRKADRIETSRKVTDKKQAEQ